jgi:branched-chain amino acid transport system substrate-binding protein
MRTAYKPRTLAVAFTKADDVFMKFLLVMAVLAGLNESAAAQPIRIGLSGSLTGRSASIGQAMRNGAKLAVSEINQAGGIMGRQVELVERDDHANVAHGIDVARELIGAEHVVATVGFVNTEVALTSQEFYEKAAIPVLNAAATGTRITHQFEPPAFKANYIFRTCINDDEQAALMAQEAIVRQHFKTPAIMVEDSEAGRDFHGLIRKALTAEGATASSDTTFGIDDTDMTIQLSRAKQGNADVILVYGAGPDLAAIANSMGHLGWKLPIIGNDALSSAGFIGGSGANGDGASMPMTFVQAGNTEKRAAFIATYMRTYRERRFISPEAAAQGYDSVWLLKAAIEQAGSTDGSAIRQALENLRTVVQGVVTVYDHPFTPTDHEAISANIPLMGIVRNMWVVAAHEEDAAGSRTVRTKQ